MSELMNISVNGQSQVPPGFRFHPTEEELLHYYLRKKIGHHKIDLDVILEVDLNRLEPWDIQERCKIGTTTQTDWYFFSHKDKKYPSGTRTNRATSAGFWKATGRDKVIYSTSSRKIIGMRKTLVFYTGRAPNGQKSDWIMYEYRLDDSCTPIDNSQQYTMHSHEVFGETQLQDEGWVVCRIFKKRNYQQKSHEYTSIDHSVQLETRMNVPDSSCYEEDKNTIRSSSWQIPIDAKAYDHSCNGSSSQTFYQPMMNGDQDQLVQGSNVTKWSAVDQLVACQLNGQDGHDHMFSSSSAYLQHHQELQFQSFSLLANQSNFSDICSLWGWT